MKKVYLSHSLQESNIGVGSYGTEMDRMRQVALAARDRLREAGVEARLPQKSWAYLDSSMLLAKVVKDSNDWRANLHICIHSNAGPKGADGTLTFYYPGSASGKKIAALIQKKVAPISPGSDYGIQSKGDFYEMRQSKAPCAYLELAFHTDKADALSVIEHYVDYGNAIADACIEYLGITTPVLTPLQLLKARVMRLEARVATLETAT
jgi:N-acetylmuramoyl-L-alanine amidase